MPPQIKTKKSLKKYFESLTEDVRQYYKHLTALIDKFPLDVALAYLFAKIELGQNMALYCGIVKLHQAEASLTRLAVNMHNKTRSDYIEKYKTVFKVKHPSAAGKILKGAEDTRDKVMHGKNVTEAELRAAIAAGLEYSVQINAHLQSKAFFSPFSPDLRGFKGATKSLSKDTTRWLLKGMGFDID